PPARRQPPRRRPLVGAGPGDGSQADPQVPPGRRGARRRGRIGTRNSHPKPIQSNPHVRSAVMCRTFAAATILTLAIAAAPAAPVPTHLMKDCEAYYYPI